MSSKTNSNILQRYRRADGVRGFGLVIECGGIRQHSVVWPDQAAQRYRTQDLEQYGIRVAVVEPFDAVELEPYLPPSDLALPDYPLPEPTAVEAEPESDEIDPEPPEEKPDWYSAALSDEDNLREYLKAHYDDDHYEVIAEMNRAGIQVSTADVDAQKNRLVTTRTAPGMEKAD